jgi:hypothetical protein
MRRLTALVVSGFASLGSEPHQPPPQYVLWQADLQVRSLTVSADKGNLTARMVVGTEAGEALGARVEVLLPVGVGIVQLGPGCMAGPNRTGISALRARVECRLGNLPARSNRELYVVTTTPPNGVPRGFAVVVMSDTPDPKPANNFVERVIPPDPREDRLDQFPDRIR